MSHLKIPEFKYRSSRDTQVAEWKRGNLKSTVIDYDGDVCEWEFIDGNKVLASGDDNWANFDKCQYEAKLAILKHLGNESINNQLAIINKLQAKIKGLENKLSTAEELIKTVVQAAGKKDQTHALGVHLDDTGVAFLTASFVKRCRDWLAVNSGSNEGAAHVNDH